MPRIGVGCAALSILSAATDDDAAVAMLVRAFERGVRYFDVAPLYGGGRGEVLLGRALRRMDGAVAVSTKVGYFGAIPYGGRQAPEERQKDFSRAAIERGIDESLRRLDRASVDILFLHDPAGDLDAIGREALPTLERLRTQGLIRAFGVGTGNVAHAAAMLDRFAVDCLLLAGRWTPIDRTGERIVERCAQNGVQLVVGGIFNSGLLASDRPANGGTFDYAPAPAHAIAQAEAVGHMCVAAGVPLKAAAVRFAGRHPGVATTLLGPRTLDELDDLLAQFELPIPPSLWRQIDALDPMAASP